MPLHLAVMNGHLQVVKLLCCFGANVNAIEGKNGRTALHYAVERRWPAVLHYLVVQCGAKIEAETYCGYSAYQLATVAAPMLAVLLIQLGARARPMPHESQNSSETEDSDLESDIPTWRPNKEQVCILEELLQVTNETLFVLEDFSVRSPLYLHLNNIIEPTYYLII